MNKFATTLAGALIGSAVFALVGVGMAHAAPERQRIEPAALATHLKEIGPAPTIGAAPAHGDLVLGDMTHGRAADDEARRIARLCEECF